MGFVVGQEAPAKVSLRRKTEPTNDNEERHRNWRAACQEGEKELVLCPQHSLSPAFPQHSPSIPVSPAFPCEGELAKEDGTNK